MKRERESSAAAASSSASRAQVRAPEPSANGLVGKIAAAIARSYDPNVQKIKRHKTPEKKRNVYAGQFLSNLEKYAKGEQSPPNASDGYKKSVHNFFTGNKREIESYISIHKDLKSLKPEVLVELATIPFTNTAARVRP